MKKKMVKRMVIWLTGALIAAFVTAAAGAAVNGLFIKTMAPAFYGYSTKESIYHPLPADERSNGLAGIAMRDSLSNCRLDIDTGARGAFIFENTIMDQSLIYFDENGLNERSAGIFASVYVPVEGKSLDYMKNAVGVVDIRKLCEQKESHEMFDVMMKNPDSVVHVNSYTVSDDYIVTPVSVTVTGKDGSHLADFSFEYSGEVVTVDCIMYNRHSDSQVDKFADSLCDKMNLGFQKQPKSDRIAEKMYSNYTEGKYADKLKVKNEELSFYEKKVFGFGELTNEYIEVTQDGRVEIAVIHNRYLKYVLLDLGIIVAVMTVIMLAVWSSKDKKERLNTEMYL